MSPGYLRVLKEQLLDVQSVDVFTIFKATIVMSDSHMSILESI